ncbi:histone acetyltransferase type b catalytic [Grosmannia clavigera kw1407]|uniref:Histone acetyltransferase type B catalytic subunit n=1 Tax=Grosmannia clavigera (strain kw1407 / UAMH 11150) TaxID=655863 RepID=F0XH12_GROCL|nr:histone acetyltransferase type b catalytic [Grosmannia clavigera kw1407]EFX02827.1 histone acetyltransferase type b catalytic [Grosmannia clavigera kw1407]
MDDWVSNANEALELSLVRAAPTGLQTVATFNPQFTYPIFGNEETIFGYQNLKILIRYNASDMRPNLLVSYGKKFKPVGENEPTDIVEVLKEFLPPVATQKSTEFEEAIKQMPAGSYRPPGDRIKDLETSDGRYEIWKGSLEDPAVKQLINRIQIFATLFIEGGSFIQTDGSDPADRWTIFFLFRTRQLPGAATSYEYEFAGYSTIYRFLLPVGAATPPRTTEFELPGSEPEFALSKLPCRSRLSQFVILPPFQGKGNAGRLYDAIFEQFLHEPQTVEITVEDPNEAFDDVRDLADLKYLSTMPAFHEVVRINTSVQIPRTGPSPKNIVDQAALDALRHETKIAPRQFHRLVEMQLMHKLAPSVRPSLDELDGDQAEAVGGPSGKGKAPIATKEQQHEYKLWRLFVKQRLYRHNKEILGQLERDQRIDKLEETLRSVELEYARILSLFESRAKLQAPATKRKLVEDIEDDGYGSSSSKKARTDEA